MSKRIGIIAMALSMGILLVSGCSTKKPDVALKEAIAKTNSATSYKIKGEIKIDRLIIKSLPAPTKKYNPQEIVDTLRATTITYDTTIDETNAKVEALCSLNTKYDGIDMSIKIPVIMDYKNETLYFGSSAINSVLSLAKKYDKKMKPKDKINLEKVKSILTEQEYIKFDLSENGDIAKELSKNKKTKKDKVLIKELQDNFTLNEEYFKKYIAIRKEARTRIINDINATAFSYSKNELFGSKKIVQITLDNNKTAKLVESIANLALDFIAQDKKWKLEIDKVDRKKITPIVQIAFMFVDINTIMSVGIDKHGYINHFNTKFEISDKKNELGNISISNENSYSNFNNAKFSFDTNDSSKYIGVMELIKKFEALDAPNKKSKNKRSKR